MARCEVCGIEQYPANTVIRFDSGHVRHFFCSHQHADGWAASPPAETPPLSLQITVEEIIEEEEVTFLCHLCGFEAKTEAGLSAHKRLKHKAVNLIE